MTLLSRAVFFALVTAGGCPAAGGQSGAPWAAPREISSFQFLLDRSPFSLPTAEESSPLADRFSLTGAVALDGEPLVFVLDKTTQTRHMLSKTPNKQNMELVEYLPGPDPRHMRATIRVNGQVATIAYAETAAQQQAAGSSANISPQVPSAVVNAPAGTSPAPGSPAFQKQGGAQPLSRPTALNDPTRPAPAPGSPAFQQQSTQPPT
ncbi:MAG: hypothetical protein WCS65_13830, partial [Verrucomicrobiae bacterium]